MDFFKRQDSRFIDAYITRNIKVLRNGDHSKYIDVALKNNTNFSHLRDEIVQKFGLRDVRVFRLFTGEGIELYDDYIPLLRDEDRVYVSLGENFDQGSSMAEYREISSLGQGGFGKVMLMENIITQKKFAVKFVDGRSYGLASLIDMVFKEAELLKNLNHKNIVEIISFFTLKDMRVVFVMEYLEGGELGEYLKQKGRLEEEEAQEIFKQLVDAVHFCHLNNIIHRDLKPENILFESKETKKIKVVDFGIAGFYTAVKGGESNAGSLRYMAPEVLTGKNQAANPAIDIWSMGVILFALLTGELPFQGRTRKEITEKIVEGKYIIAPDVRKKLSMECIDLLMKLLVVDHKSRINTFELKGHPWVNGVRSLTTQSWFEAECSMNKTTEEADKGLKISKIKSARGEINWNPYALNIKPGSERSVEREVLPKIHRAELNGRHKKSLSKDHASLKEIVGEFKEKKLSMFGESNRRALKISTMDEIRQRESEALLSKKASTPKRLNFPSISGYNSPNSKSVLPTVFKKKSKLGSE